MLIPISFSPYSSTQPLPQQLARIDNEGLVLIELQGSLEVESTSLHARDGRTVGRLRLSATDTPVTLVVGNHLLEGRIAVLPKPLAVLSRTRPVAPPTRDMDDEVGDDDGVEFESVGAPVVGWDVVAIVKRKIVFSKRPMPITTASVLTGGRKIG